MLRWAFPLLSLVIAGFSIAMDLFPRRPDSRICIYGGCRIDQRDESLVREGATPAVAAALLIEDPADPTMWCGYGEFLTTTGQSQKAGAAFARALVLGPNLSPVLMRVANFDFTHGRQEEGLRLAARILTETEAFDEIVFSYLRTSGVAVPRLLGAAIPATPRAARSWLEWQRRVGTDEGIRETWAWMRRNQLADERTAVEIATILWQHQAYRAAQELWADWLGVRKGDYLDPQLLFNARMAEAPSGAPFDWTLSPAAGVEFTQRDGLDLRFLGQENINAVGVRQLTAVEAGRYRFAAEISAQNLTTDQGVTFQIVDPENPARLTVETKPLLGNVSRSWISIEFRVPESTRVLAVELVRHPSLKFDNKISGVLHVFQVSLLRNPEPQRVH